ncbi:hypothetical protein RHSIM_RhsimUnG0093700 [Rhododendron simsii]|uniref:Aminotransferase-like plant mobile domain-containing protein n=1 Tax=Rhododendron simsii TaxID=118357 RepID=A0A834FWL5_RHOSS|nr:hypothetical protein RHSIM_RhsimUnG0093700 [Rhododendron simsii]
MNVTRSTILFVAWTYGEGAMVDLVVVVTVKQWGSKQKSEGGDAMGWSMAPSQSFGYRTGNDMVRKMEPRSSTTTMKEKIKELKTSNKQHDIDDVARLLCLFLCATLLFSTTGTTVNWFYVHYMEDLEKVKEYDWASAIANYLLKSIHKNHKELRELKGCSMLLPISPITSNSGLVNQDLVYQSLDMTQPVLCAISRFQAKLGTLLFDSSYNINEAEKPVSFDFEDTMKDLLPEAPTRKADLLRHMN